MKWLLPALALAAMPACASAEHAVRLPAPTFDVIDTAKSRVAVFAGGCFWGVEGVFEAVKGVKSVTSGYAGGTATTANYADVSSERTRHAEAVRIVYDPRIISYGTLLQIHFGAAHDPTQLNRQGPDTGPSYRSAIFPQSPAQRQIAAAYLAQLGKAKSFGAPIVTRLETGAFFPAEEHHQDFMRRNPNNGYILRWDKPKLAAFRATYPALAR
ncbi:MAG: peptide-methionine (S)-S-oxide reductase MsrA [Sphingomonadales bacterium]|jgi:peptide-methionine (S)-S-oxide reductase|nr:peptide-methionine (S)-S-oxide reductase MsrA [Sphingomonadales bacterium]